jgi:hypothetical protein
MRKTAVFGAVFAAVLAFGVIATSAASATDEWLVGGVLVGLAAKVSVVGEGSWLILLENFGAAGLTHVVCSGKLIGTVNGLNPSGRGTDTITAFEGLNGEKGTVNCEVLHTQAGPCTGSLLALVSPMNLAWLTELLLVSGDVTPSDMFASGGRGTPGYRVECTLTNGTLAVAECEGIPETEQLKNETNGTVTGVVAEKEMTKCSALLLKAKIRGSFTLKTLNAASLALS